MNIYEEEEFYRLKYLKYKTKYLQIKNEAENVIGGYPKMESANSRENSEGKNSWEASKCGMYIYLLNTSNYVPFYVRNGEEKIDKFKKVEVEFESLLNKAIKDNNSGYEVDKLICNIMNYFDKTNEFHQKSQGLECHYMKIQDSSPSIIQEIYSIYNETEEIKVDQLDKYRKDMPEVRYGKLMAEFGGNLFQLPLNTNGINVNDNGILTGENASKMLVDLRDGGLQFNYYFVKQFSCGLSKKKENKDIKLIEYKHLFPEQRVQAPK
jgi:hypothetical protein